MLTGRYRAGHALFATAVLLFGPFLWPLPAQEVLVLRGDGASCSSCTLQLARPLSLRVPDTVDALVSPFAFRQDSRGRFYFNDPFGALGIRVFSESGSYLRTIGRRGQAPGEFVFVDALHFGLGDTLHVFGNAHWVFDSNGQHVRTQSTPEQMRVSRVIVLGRGARLVVGSINSADAYGKPFHLIGATGNVVKSFGLPPRGSSVGAWANRRVVAPYGPNGFVASKMNAYELEIWTGDGELQRVIRRDASWFQPWDAWDSRSDIRPPPPRLMSLAVDDSGHIWTLSSVADANWKAAIPMSREARMASIGALRDRFDSILEIIDPISGRVLASTRFPEMLLELTRPGVVLENVEGKDGEVYVRAWTVLRRTSR